MPSNDEILKALEAVIDPELRQDIVTLGMVRSIDVAPDGAVAVKVSLTTPGCPIRNHFETGVATAASALAGVTRVDVSFDVLPATGSRARPGPSTSSPGKRRGRCRRRSGAARCPTARWPRSATWTASARARAA